MDHRRTSALTSPLLRSLCCAATIAAAAAAAKPQQLRVTLHPDPSILVASWVTVGPGASGSLLQYGDSPTKLTSNATGNFISYVSERCANTTRSVHAVNFRAPPGSDVWWRASGDGGASWSNAVVAHGVDATVDDFTISIFGDMSSTCKQSSISALINDTRAGRHSAVIHYGDAAYNMDDNCGVVGDDFLNAVQPYAASTPTVYSNGNHETGPLYAYAEYVNRLGWPQTALSNASGSVSPRWFSFSLGRTAYFVIDTDAYIYPLVWDLAEPQYIWLNATLARVNRTETPWLILIGHRALYCTKTDDGECNSEAETLRDGFLGVEFGLEALCLAHGCDLVWSGHTHHSERTWPVAKGTATQLNYVEPRGPVYIQSGIAGVDGFDPFDVPQQPWEAFRDTTFSPAYCHLIVHNDTHLTVRQLFAANGTQFDEFTIVQHSHGPFTRG